MQPILNFVTILSLLLLTVPSFVYLAGQMDLQMVKLLMLIATIVWFACTLPAIWAKEDNKP